MWNERWFTGEERRDWISSKQQSRDVKKKLLSKAFVRSGYQTSIDSVGRTFFAAAGFGFGRDGSGHAGGSPSRLQYVFPSQSCFTR